MQAIELSIPFEKRDIRTEVKIRGGKFQPQSKTWLLPDTDENRRLADLINQKINGPTKEERIANVVATCVELLNAVGYRKYHVVEVGDKVVIESEPKES